MNTKIKYILFVVVICIIIVTMIIVGSKYKKNKEEQNRITETTETEKITTKEPLIEETKIENIETEIKEEYVNVWTTTNVKVRKEPNIDSEIVDNYRWNTELTVVYINDDWAKIKDTECYIDRDSISEVPNYFVNRDVPTNNTIKSYMDYRTITARNSNQYKLQQSAYTGDNGLRMINDRYCIAVGSYYTTTIGQYIDIELENGSIIYGILADCKADIHTDSTNRINPNGSVIEFVVDTNFLNPTSKLMGDISYVNGWNSKVVNIKVYDKIEEY